MKGNAEVGRQAFERALELLDLTIADEKHRSRLKELTRLREAPADCSWFDNRYGSCGESWRRYFLFGLICTPAVRSAPSGPLSGRCIPGLAVLRAPLMA